MIRKREEEEFKYATVFYLMTAIACLFSVLVSCNIITAGLTVLVAMKGLALALDSMSSNVDWRTRFPICGATVISIIGAIVSVGMI